MRSCVLKQADPREVDLSQWIKPIPVNEEQVHAEMKRLTNPYVEWKRGKTVAAGDIAVLRLESCVARFQRSKVKFIVGSGMFDTAVEQGAIGMRVGESRELSLSEGTVLLTLLEVTNRIDPEPTDAMVEALAIDGVRTVPQYRAYIIRKLKEQSASERMFEPLNHLIDELIDRSEFILNRKDWELFVTAEVERIRTLFSLEGIRMEEATPEQYASRMPFHSFDEFLVHAQQDAWTNLCMFLLGVEHAKTDGFTIGKDEYEDFIRDYMKQWRETEENARRITPYDAFIRGKYIAHASALCSAIISEAYLKEE